MPEDGRPTFDGPQRDDQPANAWGHIAPESKRRVGESSWQPLVEMPHLEEDLVSIFQDDYGLNVSPAVKKDRSGASIREVSPSAQVVVEETQPFLVASAKSDPVETVRDITFYLAPQVTSHFLVGGLALQLRAWLPEICQTYGWQLESLSVRPDYLRWTLGDFPEVLIREMLQIVRAKTTQRIFRVYPNLRKAESPEDFWAPGYLVDMQERDFTTQALMLRIARGRFTH